MIVIWSLQPSYLDVTLLFVPSYFLFIQSTVNMFQKLLTYHLSV